MFFRPTRLVPSFTVPVSRHELPDLLGIGLLVGLLYAVLDFRSPAPPAIALVGLLGMQLGEQLFPLGRDLLQQWLH